MEVTHKIISKVNKMNVAYIQDNGIIGRNKFTITELINIDKENIY